MSMKSEKPDIVMNKAEGPLPSEAYCSRLPVETLTKIFLFACSDYRSGSTSGLDIAQICQHWRSVAIAYPFLWDQIIIDGRTEVQLLFLERSKQVPLDFSLPELRNPKDLHYLEGLRNALAQSHRIRRLELRLSNDSIAIVQNAFMKPFPKLEEVQLRYSSAFYFSGNISTTPLLDEFWNNGFLPLVVPSLKKVVLGDFYFTTFDTARLSELRSLEISALVYGSWPIPADILANLRLLPLLEELTLCGDFVLPKFPEDVSEPIALPNMKKLFFLGTILGLVKALETILYPPTATISITIMAHSTDEDYPWRRPSVLLPLSSLLSRPLIDSGHKYELSVNLYKGVRFDGVRVQELRFTPLVIPDASDIPHLTVLVPLDRPYDDGVYGICARLPMNKVIKLRVSRARRKVLEYIMLPPKPIMSLGETLPLMTNLEIFHATECDEEAIAPMLCMSKQFRWPNLKEVLWSECCFRRYPLPDDIPHPPGMVFEEYTLGYALELTFKVIGWRLRLLTLENCEDVRKEEVKIMRRFVDRLEWIEDEGSDEDEGEDANMDASEDEGEDEDEDDNEDEDEDEDEDGAMSEVL